MMVTKTTYKQMLDRLQNLPDPEFKIVMDRWERAYFRAEELEPILKACQTQPEVSGEAKREGGRGE